MKNHSEIAEFLWHIADLIKDDYDAKDYEDVILPFTLLRRLDCVLEGTHDAVQTAAKKYKGTPEKTRDELLKKAAGQGFYNTSEFTLASLLKRPNDLNQNFAKYLDGFSPNVKDILYNFSGGEEKGLDPIFETLHRKRLLFKVTQAFSEAPLDPETVDNHGMGTIFEYLIRKFKEASNEAAGQFYTPREIIRLMVKLLFEPDRRKLGREKLVGIYDPACGTGGMLTVAKAGYDDPILIEGTDQFVRDVTALGAQVTLLTHDDGSHAFDIRNNDDRSREIIKQTIEFMKSRLIE